MLGKRILVLLLLVFVVCVGIYLASQFTKDTAEPATVTAPKVDIGTAIANLEQDKAIDSTIKQQLVDQGYPADAVDGLLLQGAQKATPLKNIASVLQEYGYPWNEPLTVGPYELVSLYLIGNEAVNKFVLGQYQDETGEKVIFLHMSVTAPVQVLQAGLRYSKEQPFDGGTAYIDDANRVVGFKFEVQLEGEKEKAVYVATTSGIFTESDITHFIESVVDGSIM